MDVTVAQAVQSLGVKIKERVVVFDLSWVFLFGLLVRLWLIISYPAMYGGDPIVRLVHTDKIIIGYNLPLLQFLIFLTSKISSHPFMLRFLMVLIGSVAGCGLYLLVTKLFDKNVARLAALLFIVNPFILVNSIVPYQEILMLASLFLGGYFLIRGRSSSDRYISSFFISMACLTRYEGWMAALFIVAITFLHGLTRTNWSINLKKTIYTTIFFCWVPILWLLWNRGLNPEGTFVLDNEFTFARLLRIPYIVAKTIYVSTPAVAFLGFIGLVIILLSEKRRDKRLLAIAGFFMLFLTILTIWGHDYPPGSNLVTEREVHVPLCLFLICAAFGMDKIFRWVYNLTVEYTQHICRDATYCVSTKGIITVLMLLIIISFPLKMAYDEVYARSSEPGPKVSYLASQVIDKIMNKNEKVLILAKEWQKSIIDSALQRRFGKDSPNAMNKALKMAEELTLPPDYQLLVASSRYGKNELISTHRYRNLSETDMARFLNKEGFKYLIVFSDFMPESPGEEFILKTYDGKKEILAKVGDDVKFASIYRIQSSEFKVLSSE
ncbi:MAG TPA: ArnT family glycosyltransferase [Candidatus Brocadiia bacterium]|nr:glycosyltransferase family 39 protein [Planctomycetota bacterium]MDO8093994.1 glycosyltransferase family 39 protein [Candidatus Brocadiales bacterium]